MNRQLSTPTTVKTVPSLLKSMSTLRQGLKKLTSTISSMASKCHLDDFCGGHLIKGLELTLEYRDTTERDLSKAETALAVEVGSDGVNVNSPKQVAFLLYDKLGYPPQFKLGAKDKYGNKKTSKTVDDDALTKLNKLYPNPVFPLILEVRRLKKLLSTYLKQFWDDDGRCRASFRITGAETGRLSSTENIRRTGLQLQNIPKRIRDVFIADDGCELLKVDLSQVE